MEFLKKFESHKRYVFDKDIYIEHILSIGEIYDEKNECEKYWTDNCNNKYIRIKDQKRGEIKIGDSTYEVMPQWCREVPVIRILTEKDL